MEEYVWISKLAYHPVFVSHAHPVLNRFAELYNVQVTIAGPEDAETEPYIKAICDAIDRKVAGIAVIGFGDVEAIAAVEKAVERGIPVVSVDSDIPNSKCIAHVGTDWFRMGAAMAEKLAGLIDGHGKVLMIGMPDLANMQAGFQGFRQCMDRYQKIEVMGPIDDMDVGPEKAKSIVKKILRKHPDLKGIAGFDGNSGPGAALAIEKLGKESDVKIVCVDADSLQIEHIKTGAIDAAYCQKREAFTYFALQLLYSYNHGTTFTGYTPGTINIPGNVDTGFVVVTTENLKTFETELSLDEAFELHEMSQRLSLISSMIENSTELAFATDVDGRIVYANPASIRLCGYEDGSILGLNLNDIFQITDNQQAKMTSCIKDRMPDNFETAAIKKDGSCFQVQLSISPLKANRTVRGIVIIAQDITERKQAEEALRTSHERFLTVLDSIDATIYVANMDTHEILFMNKHMIEGFGGDMTGEICWEVFRGESKPCQHCTNDQLIDENGKPTGVCVWQGKNPITGKWYVNYDRAIEWLDGSLVRIQIATDITEIKKMEGQLQQAQKMESIGTLAGGIAHDFNNLLMGIQGRTSLMLMEADTYHPYNEHLKGIEDYVKNATDLTKQLLAFARGGKYEVKPTDLNTLINKSSEMFGRTKKEIIIHRKSQQKIWTVEIDRSQIEQVLLNLYVNAWQSMPGGGEFYLETENVMLDSDYVKPYSVEPGKYVKISVTDTGVGMDKATRERIFDPFFTTKEMGRGTGLGLASAYGIIKNHNGFINVFSEKGEGATFSIYLPASEKEVIYEKRLSEEVSGGLETILLVDDEAMIIEIGKELLKKMGYKVLTAKNGEAAVELYEENKDEIDLVILDMIMPDMGGGETYNRLKENDPDIKALLSSGYSINGQATEILERGCDGFIQKPYSIIDLSQKIREILDKN